MKFYDMFMYPLEKIYLSSIRKSLMKKVSGDILEIGFATGVNMQYYNQDNINSISAIDINEDMVQFDNVNYYVLEAENLPFKDSSFDTIIMTLALCSIKDPKKALLEIKRVLKPNGKYLFIEHEQSNSKIISKVFNLINPIWSKFTGGCNINRKSHLLIKEVGFNLNYNNKNVFYYGVATKE